MKSELLSLLSFAISIAAYTGGQLAQHGKLQWSKRDDDFWGPESWRRKYKQPLKPPSTNFQDISAYYKMIKSPYRERWFTSTWLTVAFTDFYHLSQALFFLFISLSVVPMIGWTYGIAFWILAHITHWILYRTLQR